MRLPENIKGIHKLRDYRICYLWIEELISAKDIGEKIGLTERRVQQILRTNHAFAPIDKDWEKKKRIHLLKVAIKNSQESKKDRADLIDQLRREIEGEKPLIHIGNNQFFDSIISKPKLKNRVEDLVGNQN